MRQSVPINVAIRLGIRLAAAVLLLAVAAPVAAKENLVARLDAPIALGTPAGTMLLVGVTVTLPEGAVEHPVDGSPIYLRLTGRDGSATWALGATDGKPGHYVMRIVVPAGGARAAEVGMHGSSDLPIRLVGEPFRAGPVTAGTAQVAPPPVPALTPFPRASAAVPAAVPTVVAAAVPAAQPRAATAAQDAAPLTNGGPTPDAGPAPLVVAGLIVALALALAALIGGLLAVRRGRSGLASDAPGRAPGA